MHESVAPLFVAATNKLRIIHECSCFIDFIKRVGEEIKCKACRAFYLFCNKLNKFKNTRARVLDSIIISH